MDNRQRVFQVFYIIYPRVESSETENGFQETMGFEILTKI